MIETFYTEADHQLAELTIGKR
ncbi:Hha/YmoA family nucleoid-associated regulatory protein [Serratia fonticola]